MQVGIEMSWYPGGSLPPKSTGQAIETKYKETVMLTDTLFANDMALYGE